MHALEDLVPNETMVPSNLQNRPSAAVVAPSPSVELLTETEKSFLGW